MLNANVTVIHRPDGSTYLEFREPEPFAPLEPEPDCEADARDPVQDLIEDEGREGAAAIAAQTLGQCYDLLRAENAALTTELEETRREVCAHQSAHVRTLEKFRSLSNCDRRSREESAAIINRLNAGIERLASDKVSLAAELDQERGDHCAASMLAAEKDVMLCATCAQLEQTYESLWFWQGASLFAAACAVISIALLGIVVCTR
jgi:hypothetical protein